MKNSYTSLSINSESMKFTAKLNKRSEGDFTILNGMSSFLGRLANKLTKNAEMGMMMLEDK